MFLLGRSLAFSADIAQPNGPKMQLLPSEHRGFNTNAASELVKSKWVFSSVRDILGRGSDTVFQFSALPGTEQFLVEKIVRGFPSVNDKSRTIAETVTKAYASIEGCVLKIGVEAHSFVIIPGKSLLMDAVVPLSPTQWYYANVQTIPASGGRPEWQDHLEYIFEFSQDPMQRDHGEAVVFRFFRGEKVGGPAQFTVEPDKAWREFKHVRFSGDKVVTEFYMSDSGAYGLWQEINKRTTIYAPPAATLGTKPMRRKSNNVAE